MNRIGLAVLAAISLTATTASAQNAERIPSLSASGEGVVTAAPDLAIVNIGVVSKGATAREALDANNTDMQSVIDAIRAAGIEDPDIGTSGFSINPVYDIPPEPLQGQPREAPSIVGYEVTNQVTVRIRELAESGAVLDQVVSAGANQINSISFDIDDQEKLRDEAIRLAIADARRKAEIMAEAAGVDMLRILSVSINDFAQPVMFDRAVAMAAPAPAVPILGGEHSITVNATVEWEIGAASSEPAPGGEVGPDGKPRR
jgi:uncharacterized protein YggE